MDLLDGLKAFVATAQTGSFTEAAERLGARLLQRTTRKVGLTPTGQEILARAPTLLEELEDLLSTVSAESKGLTSLLRIAAPVTFGEMYISEMLSRFASYHPELSIDLRLNDTHVDLATDGLIWLFVSASRTLRRRKN